MAFDVVVIFRRFDDGYVGGSAAFRVRNSADAFEEIVLERDGYSGRQRRKKKEEYVVRRRAGALGWLGRFHNVDHDKGQPPTTVFTNSEILRTEGRGIQSCGFFACVSATMILILR